MQHRALNELLSAAMINQDFRKTLLSDANLALSEGYGGYYFDLSRAEVDLVTSIEAENIEAFASVVVDWMEKEINLSTTTPHQVSQRYRFQWVDRDVAEEGESWLLPGAFVASETVL